MGASEWQRIRTEHAATTTTTATTPLTTATTPLVAATGSSTYIKAPAHTVTDEFGHDVAIDGTTIVVGAPLEDTTGADAGAAYVYVMSGGVWTLQQVLRAPVQPVTLNIADRFGGSVDVSGDTIVVGAWGEDGSGTGVNAAVNDLAANAGAAYVFVRAAGVWTLQATLKASNTFAVDAFGQGVAISGNTIVVTAPFENNSTTNGNVAQDFLAVDSGAAYVFQRTGTTWAQEAYLKASNAQLNDYFGGSPFLVDVDYTGAVDIDGDTIVVGAPLEDSVATGVGGSQGNWDGLGGSTFPLANAANIGAAYVFKRSAPATWAQEAYLKPSNTDPILLTTDNFGTSVAISGDAIIVGSPFEDGNGVGVNPADNNLGVNAGAAYTFTRSGATWSPGAYLKQTNTTSQIASWFGWSVGIAGTEAIVGAPFEDSNGVGLNGASANILSADSGAAYSYTLSGAGATAVNYYKACNNTIADYYGHSVAIVPGCPVVGAPYEDGSGVLINPADDNAAGNAGAVYIPGSCNTPPTIVPTPVTRPANGVTANVPIATVMDLEDLETALVVTINGGAMATVNGVTVSGITVNAAGIVSANVVAACGATNATFTLRVTDTGGLFAQTLTFTVTVTPDATPPTITCPANITTNTAPGLCTAAVTFAPTATDNCAVATLVCTPASGFAFPKGTTPVSCTATDASGNTATCGFNVTVNDTQAPVVTCPANIVKSTDPNLCTAVTTFVATATDNCPGVTLACVPPSGTAFAKGTTTVTCTATDAAANTAACSFTVTVNDTQAPAITCPANIFVGTTGTTQTATWAAPVVSDNCPGVGAPTCVPPSGSTFPLGVTTVTCSVTDASANTSTCPFTVTVNKVAVKFSDPLVCFGPGDVVTGTVTLTNNGAANVNAVANVALPAGLVLIPGSCVASVGTCTLTPPSAVAYNGSIPPGQTATITYQAQFGDVAAGTQLCATTTVSFNGGPTLTVIPCVTANCPAIGPGGVYPSTSAISDQKPGSVLLYPVYTSDAANGAAQNARLSFTNIHPSRTAYLHLFFVDGSSCSVADSYICLTPNQTAAFLASDVDPGSTGYVVAVATDLNGCPISFNYLIGDEYVKFASGHAANLGAEAIAAIAGGLPACNLNSDSAVLNFNGVSYNALPRVLAASSLPSRLDGNDTLLIIDRIGGNLGTGAATIGTLFGLLYDDAEKTYSFSLPAGTCQSRGSLTNDRPRVVPRFEQVIGAGRTGWLKVYGGADIGIIGAQINRNTNAVSNSGAFNQGHNLHKLTLTTTASYTIPVFPPTC